MQALIEDVLLSEFDYSPVAGGKYRSNKDPNSYLLVTQSGGWSISHIYKGSNSSGGPITESRDYITSLVREILQCKCHDEKICKHCKK